MTQDRFSWNNFDDDTVNALAEGYGFPPQSEISHRDWLSDAVKRPNDRFVRITKSLLEDYWLAAHPRVAKSIVEYLLVEGIGPRERPQSDAGYVDYIRKCRNAATVRWLLCQALVRFGDTDRNADLDEDGVLDAPIPRFAKLRPGVLQPDAREPHPYQREAQEALSERYADAQSSGDFRGLLVMPTGSGKTFTAVRWLVRSHVNRGGRVLWIAHRHDLLTQAASAFHRAAFLADSREELRIRIVSGVHHRPTTVGPEDHIVLWSIQSLSRRLDLAEDMLRHENVFLVIDEAHHAPAKTYRQLFDILQQRKQKLVLGLTATPTRTIEDERSILTRLFGETKLYEVSIRDLVERRYLARPYSEVVRTQVAAEEGITKADVSHLERFGELSEAWRDRMAKIALRNEVIIQRYLGNADRYGKTLVFAINVAHAQLLRDRFREAGVEAEYVASYRPDDEKINYAEVLDRFKRPQSGLDVLINVEILTEGVDIPCIQTIFLTRPTHSEVLLRQMIGRALRGPKVADGTERAYLVSFEDHWSEFADWEYPFELVPDIVECAPEAKQEEEVVLPAPKPLVDALPWELIKASVDELRRLKMPWEATAFEAVPHGWYVLERDDDGEEVRHIVHVYAHQRSCWEALIQQLWQFGEPLLPAGRVEFTVGAFGPGKPVEVELRNEQSADQLYETFFIDCDVPRPSRHQIGQMVQHYRAGGERPEFVSFSQRDQADPFSIAREIIDSDLGPAAKDALITQRHSLPLAAAVYPSLWTFTKAINDAIFELQHPEQRERLPKAEITFEPLPNTPLRPGPAHDLETLLQQVIKKAKDILQESIVFDGPVRWSNQIICNYFAQARWQPSEPHCTGLIVVNRLLDTPDVTAATMKFILWHEILHLYLQAGHSPRFRELERSWPGHIEANRELFTLNERFGVFYW